MRARKIIEENQQGTKNKMKRTKIRSDNEKAKGQKKITQKIIMSECCINLKK